LTKEVTVSNISNRINIQLEEDGQTLGIVVVGGISVDEYVDQTLLNEENRAEWRENIKEAYANEVEFNKIKKARKKAARRLKRKN
jgi:hypothetical protein